MMVVDGVDMVDVQEAARLVGRTPETVRRWVWSGRLSAVKNGQKLFVPRNALLALTDVRAPAPPDRPSLRSWAREARRAQATGAQPTARGLVLDDRARR